jgi:hypothetical protein
MRGRLAGHSDEQREEREKDRIQPAQPRRQPHGAERDYEDRREAADRRHHGPDDARAQESSVAHSNVRFPFR